MPKEIFEGFMMDVKKAFNDVIALGTEEKQNKQMAVGGFSPPSQDPALGFLDSESATRLQSELLLSKSRYSGLYTALQNLEQDYKKKQPSAGRMDAVRFINSVQNTLVIPSKINTEITNQHQMQANINQVDGAYHILLGACFYMHKRIKDDYKGSWSASLWSEPEKSSQLFKILDELLSDLEQSTKQMAINQLKVHMMQEQANVAISLPHAKKSAVAETYPQMIDNINALLDEACPSTSLST